MFWLLKRHKRFWDQNWTYIKALDFLKYILKHKKILNFNKNFLEKSRTERKKSWLVEKKLIGSCNEHAVLTIQSYKSVLVGEFSNMEKISFFECHISFLHILIQYLFPY